MNGQNAFIPGQVQWEYRQITATPIDKLMAVLESEGRNGWELVCVTVEEPYYRAFLKRSAQDSGPAQAQLTS